MIPPKPEPRADKVSLWKYLRLFRKDILSAQPARLYRAWMAEFRTPFFSSFLINQPDLVKTVLNMRPQDFPKSGRVGEGLRPLLGNSVFLTNGKVWERQRRIIDPAFEGGRIKDTFPAMQAAANAAVTRLEGQVGAPVEIEEVTSHAAADVIFRTLFSVPIEDEVAGKVFTEFRRYQRTQPILNLAAFLPIPRWMPRLHRLTTKKTAAAIRALITEMTARRQMEISVGLAPDDLATKIMTTPDPVTGERFTTGEMVDQVAIFFLAGHETSASALAWTLYLIAANPDIQGRIAAEVSGIDPLKMGFPDISKLKFTRDVFREALRLYPPVPMMVRETTQPETFRDRTLPIGAQVVISPWHLQRHTRLWDDPDAFRPERWQTPEGKSSAREAFVPFSSGRRVCTGASFAMAEAVILLAALVSRFRFSTVPGKVPVPEAHLTVRARDGIWLQVADRESGQD